VAAWKLANLECAIFVGEVSPQKGIESGDIEFFARANGCRVIQEVAQSKPP